MNRVFVGWDNGDFIVLGIGQDNEAKDFNELIKTNGNPDTVEFRADHPEMSQSGNRAYIRKDKITYDDTESLHTIQCHFCGFSFDMYEGYETINDEVWCGECTETDGSTPRL